MSWSRESVVAELKEFDWSLPDAEPGPELRAYSGHYHLNFDEVSEALSHQAGFLNIADFQIVVQRWMCPNARGTAVIIHGYYDHLGLYGSLIDYCLRQQLNVIAFDLPGHGLSSGEQATIRDFQEYDAVFSGLMDQITEYMDDGPASKLVAFGQSTGGAILINYLLKRGFNVETCPFNDVILLAPLVRPVGWRKGVWSNYEGGDSQTVSRFGSGVGSKIPSSNIALGRVLAGIALYSQSDLCRRGEGGFGISGCAVDGNGGEGDVVGGWAGDGAGNVGC